MPSRTALDHPSLGHLEYDKRLDWYSTKLALDGESVDLRIHCDGAAGEPPALSHAARMVGKVKELCRAAKECAVRDLLDLKNDTWLDEDEPEVDAEQFKRLMRLEGIVVYGDGSAEFYHLDGDLFWGHCILVHMDASERFDKADIAG
jgi:hypothetical protein